MTTMTDSQIAQWFESDWAKLAEALSVSDYELVADIFKQNHVISLAWDYYNYAFKRARKEAQNAKTEYMDPLNTAYIAFCYRTAWENNEQTCKRIAYKLSHIAD